MLRPVVLALAALVLAPGPASAQQKLTIAGYGGSFEQMMRKDLFPPFEKQHNVKIEFVAGNSTDNLARLQAQRGNQEIDAVFLDDGPMYQAVALGFCADIRNAPVLSDIYENARMGPKAIAVGMVATGLMYNRKIFADNGWPAPSSWNDLKDPKYRKKVVIPPLNNTYGLHAVVIAARLKGGGEKAIDPGFAAFKSEIGPNVLAYEPQPGKMTELFQSGQAVIGVWGSGRVKAFQDTGFPVEFVYPKEGGLLLGVTLCPVARNNASPLAQEFLQYILSPDVQVQLARGQGFGPVNRKAVLPADAQRGVPYGEQAAKLISVDWATINANREDWNKRWTREIER